MIAFNCHIKYLRIIYRGEKTPHQESPHLLPILIFNIPYWFHNLLLKSSNFCSKLHLSMISIFFEQWCFYPVYIYWCLPINSEIRHEISLPLPKTMVPCYQGTSTALVLFEFLAHLSPESRFIHVLMLLMCTSC